MRQAARQRRGARHGAWLAAGRAGAPPPRAPARPAAGAAPPDPVHVAALEAEVQELRLEVEAAQVRQMLAIAAPGTVAWGPTPVPSKKKTTGGPHAR